MHLGAAGFLAHAPVAFDPVTILGPTKLIKTSALEPYPGNARRGDVDAIAKSLQVNGQFQPIIYQLSTQYVLVGNHTLRAAQNLRWAEVQAAPVDVDDEQARKIVLAANRTSDLATYDLDALVGLLRDVDDLEGTGFTSDDLSELLDDGNEPEGDAPDRESKQRTGVVIYTRTEEEQLELMSRMLEEGWEARAL